MRPLAIDLFCGLGGWTEGLLEAGWNVIGFDIERHAYGTEKYPAQLVIQDVLTIHGSQFRNADLIVASPPCQEYSYMAMPWSRAKQIAAALRGNGDFPKGYKGSRTVAELTALFDATFRIQREASEAAGRHIPMVVENVRGAQPWVGKARANYGSFYLWGDIPALMPVPHKARKVPGFRFDGSGRSFQTASVALGDGVKAGDRGDRNKGPSEWRPPRRLVQRPGQPFAAGRDHQVPRRHEAIQTQRPARQRQGSGRSTAKHGSKSSARKAASARIAKIPIRLGRHIAQFYRPERAA